MRKLLAFVLLPVIIMSCKQAQNIDELKKKYILDDLSLYIENPLPGNDDPNRYTLDNKVYRINRKFIFDYFIVKGSDTFKITSPTMASPDGDYQREWAFIAKNSPHEEKIETISITVMPGITNETQTTLHYEYQYSPTKGNTGFNSTSGVIENEMNAWMHPHRDKYFMILELNPFPFIQQPFEIGHTWTWNLEIGDYWKDERWKAWTGAIENKYKYEIIGKEELTTKIGKLECWIVQGIATSTIGSTGLIAYFNEEHGFVKMDYINIDKSRLTIEIKEIK